MLLAVVVLGLLLVARSAESSSSGGKKKECCSAQISYVVLFDESQRAHLRAGIRTWMRLVPGTIYLAHEQKPPKGLRGLTYVRVRSTVDYVDICRQAYASTKSNWV